MQSNSPTRLGKRSYIPLVILFYFGALVVVLGASFKLISPLYNWYAGGAMIAILVLLLPLLLRLNLGKRWVQLAIFILAHTCGALMLIYAINGNSPYSVFWILLMTQSYLYLGMTGFSVSALVFAGSNIATVLANPEIAHTAPAAELTLASIIFAAFMTACALATVRVLQRSRANEEHLEKAREHEILEYERLKSLINAMGDAVIGTDKNGTILIYNAATLSLLDTNASLEGKNIGDVLHLVDKEDHGFKLMAYIESVGHGFSRRDLRHIYDGKDSATLYMNVSSVQPNYKQKLDQGGYIFILRDITKEKSLEDERDEFISVISHELRTPVAIMEGSTSNLQFLLSQPADVPKKDLQATIEQTHDQALYLADMINDLSTLSRAERKEAEVQEEIDVQQLATNLTHRYEPDATKKGLKLLLHIGEDLGTITTSKLYLEEILQNFITNAIKYTAEGSVTLDVAKSEAGTKFSVTDTGIGISTSDQKHVFDKFWRSEDFRTRETGGTGLGLYVTRKLADKLGTVVELKSELNKGSTFSFTLSKVGTPTPAEATPQPTVAATSAKS